MMVLKESDYCPHCGRLVALTTRGLFYRHSATGTGKDVCPGTGQSAER